MVVPMWSHNPPESINNYIKERHFLLYFFSAVNPWVFLMSLIAWLLTIKVDTGARTWIGRATLIAWIMLPLKIWMIFKVGGIFRSVMENNFKPDMVNTINLYKSLNWLTIATATIILVFHLLAIRDFNKSPVNK